MIILLLFIFKTPNTYKYYQKKDHTDFHMVFLNSIVVGLQDWGLEFNSKV
ncbi:Hypothetical protein I595_123 [Croceitalea dokdonensis DOKDO 023]|uniref:Uncharacterized protein n=1 Tax=Croceitalea dokdonensis DOKDO 023 TaxID=1300341 RepID=A0A0N8H4F4_9FLAO|nr:Hypothetical protein I595_123 [Croceitalea dokdonensis DOKDO 023]